MFRKGAALGTGEVDEDEEGEGGMGDVSGEELRKEVSCRRWLDFEGILLTLFLRPPDPGDAHR